MSESDAGLLYFLRFTVNCKLTDKIMTRSVRQTAVVTVQLYRCTCTVQYPSLTVVWYGVPDSGTQQHPDSSQNDGPASALSFNFLNPLKKFTSNFSGLFFCFCFLFNNFKNFSLKYFMIS